MAIFETSFPEALLMLMPLYPISTGWININGNASAAVADLNHNGKPDLIFAMNTTPYSHHGNGK